MKFIEITGEGDYNIDDFVSLGISIQDIYKEMKENKVNKLTKEYVEFDYSNTLEFTLLEFGDVDINFLEYMHNNLIDYDSCRYKDIFVVEEE